MYLYCKTNNFDSVICAQKAYIISTFVKDSSCIGYMNMQTLSTYLSLTQLFHWTKFSQLTVQEKAFQLPLEQSSFSILVWARSTNDPRVLTFVIRYAILVWNPKEGRKQASVTNKTLIFFVMMALESILRIKILPGHSNTKELNCCCCISNNSPPAKVINC